MGHVHGVGARHAVPEGAVAPGVDAVGRRAEAAGARGAAARPRRCCCSTSRTTSSTSPPSAGSRTRLVESPKTVLFVSHDRELLDRVATRIATLEPSRGGNSLWVHPGRFSTYAGPGRAQRPARGAAPALGRGAGEAQGAGAHVPAEGGRTTTHGLAPEGRRDPVAQFEAAGPPERCPCGRRWPCGSPADARPSGPSSPTHSSCGSTGADAAVRPRDLVRRAGRRARQQRLGQVALPAAARRRRQRPTASTSRSATSVRPRSSTPAGPCSGPGCAPDGSPRPTSTRRCSGARCSRSCTAGTTTAPGCHGSSPPGRSTGTGWRRAAEQTFDTLSGGQQARLQILLLELSGATLLLLDEPTDNLDLHSAEALENGLGGVRGHRRRGHPRRWFARGFDRFLVFRADGRVAASDEAVWDEGRVGRPR